MAGLILLATLLPAQAEVGKKVDVLDPNLASDKELEAMPYSTPDLQKALRAQRPFIGLTAWNAFLVAQVGAEHAVEARAKFCVPIDLNHASREEILLVPGVGRRMAHEFEEYRPYRHLAQFRKEIGKYVDAKEVARLEQYVFVPIHLNTASDEDILSIPGVGKRMLHEFKEYRPYKNLEQFRREIGKYVDAKEVARLESFVTLE
jgi:DNA uptake protein ComE-like DNA-binding protein